LKQRQEALSQLITITSKYVGHQQVLIEKIRSLKFRFQSTRRLGAKIKISNEITLTLQSLFALVEAYPELKRNPDFLTLQKQVSSYQFEISKWSRTFNQHVELYNSKVLEIPESLMAKLMGYRELDPVVIEELQNSLSKNNLNLAA
jgi:LemA protein